MNSHFLWFSISVLKPPFSEQWINNCCSILFFICRKRKEGASTVSTLFTLVNLWLSYVEKSSEISLTVSWYSGALIPATLNLLREFFRLDGYLRLSIFLLPLFAAHIADCSRKLLPFTVFMVITGTEKKYTDKTIVVWFQWLGKYVRKKIFSSVYLLTV